MTQVASAADYWFPLVMDVPIVRFLGAKAVDPADPTAGLSLVVGPNGLNAADVLHGGAIATILDLAAYLAVLPLVGPDEQAVTHAFSANYLAATAAGDELVAKGAVLKRSRRVAFTTSTVMCGDRLIATASVTKSIIDVGPR